MASLVKDPTHSSWGTELCSITDYFIALSSSMDIDRVIIALKKRPTENRENYSVFRHLVHSSPSHYRTKRQSQLGFLTHLRFSVQNSFSLFPSLILSLDGNRKIREKQGQSKIREWEQD